MTNDQTDRNENAAGDLPDLAVPAGNGSQATEDSSDAAELRRRADDSWDRGSVDDDWGPNGSWSPLPKPDRRSPDLDVPPSPKPSVAVAPPQQAQPAPAVSTTIESRGKQHAGPASKRASDKASNQASNQAADGGSLDYEAFPPRRRGRAFLGFLLTLALIAAGVLFALNWYQKQVDPPGPPSSEVEVVIPPSTSTASIAKLLEKSDVISNATVFRYWTQVQGKGRFDAGKYKFRQNSSFESALDVLLTGPAVADQQKVTFPEGFRIEQIGQRIEQKLSGRSAATFYSAATDGKVRSAYQPATVSSLEGFLFPDTYTVGLEDDETLIAQRMVETFDSVADQLGLNAAQERVGVSPYEALIVAALVEREAKTDADRSKIARVIYNRLKGEMYLQIDAGIIYAMNNGTTKLLLEDLKFTSPYNTYTNKGLPPGPIANPGRASIEAALNPEPGDWLYYVVTGADGSHSFTPSFKEHKRNIKLAKERGLR